MPCIRVAAGLAASSLSGLPSLILLTPPTPTLFTPPTPHPAPHGEDLHLFCSPLFLWNLEKWLIHSRDLIYEQMDERVVEKI